MKITEILPRRGRIFEVRFDDGTYINLDKTFFESLSLKAGDQISDEKANELEDLSDMKRCKNRAFYYLSNSSMSEKNLRAKLLKSGFAPRCVEKVVERCKQLLYIDDHSFAQRVKEKCDQNNFSNRATADKLIISGISGEKVKEICLYDSFSEQEKIKHLLKTKYEKKLSTKEEIQKVIASLQRKGFLFSDINSVLRSYTYTTEE